MRPSYWTIACDSKFDCMNILILGASSQIGRELALSFSSNNALVILGRNKDILDAVASDCLGAGAQSVDCIVQDMAAGADLLMQAMGDRQLDLVINLVASTSRVKDSEFLPSQLESYLMSDLLVPVQLFEKLIENSSKPLKIIFVSSVLADVQSPDRLLYGALKSLQEICLRKFTDGGQKNNLLVVKVGMVVSHEQPSDESRRLAAAIYEAHLLDKKVLNYGMMGRAYLLLFYAQPMIFRLIVKLQRLLRGN
jgi:NAD(P)-dependent dehydrogenase (short-subunit alcohol dehydrogenase family)